MPRFFEDLDRQLRTERGPNGEPSTNDFQVLELIRIVDRFAVEFDDLPRLISEREDYRVLVMSGTLVPAFSVIGQLATDGAVELVQLDMTPTSIGRSLATDPHGQPYILNNQLCGQVTSRTRQPTLRPCDRCDQRDR